MEPKLEINRIILFVKNMKGMVAFYGDVVGLARVSVADDSPDFVTFDAGGVQLSLHQIPEDIARGIRIDDPPVARSATPIKFAFHVADVTAASEALRARGAEMGPVREFGTLALCDGTDPEGNVFQLSSRP